MVCEPSSHPGMPSDRHPNSLPVEVSHILCMVPQERSSIDCFLPCALKMWCATNAGRGIILDSVSEKILGKGECGIILGGAIRLGKKLFCTLGCGILAGGSYKGESCIATGMLVHREEGGVTILGGGTGITTLRD
eukprot:8590148-Ditylum_brightwellii.AAC.1